MGVNFRPCPMFKVRVILVKKAQARIGKFFSQLLNLSYSVLLKSPTHWGLETAACLIFAKLVLDIFAVCLLVPRINLSHMQQGYLCPKNQNYLLGKVDLGFFLSYGLRATAKVQHSALFMFQIIFEDSFNKIFF